MILCSIYSIAKEVGDYDPLDHPPPLRDIRRCSAAHRIRLVTLAVRPPVAFVVGCCRSIVNFNYNVKASGMIDLSKQPYAIALLNEIKNGVIKEILLYSGLLCI